MISLLLQGRKIRYISQDLTSNKWYMHTGTMSPEPGFLGPHSGRLLSMVFEAPKG